MSTKPFKFKQFTVAQDNCAMKIGTDGVLLGAWVAPQLEPEQVLDIGTGTGIIALQLAQRFATSDIEAIEIDEKAFEQCTHNFENSPWADRLFCYHASIQDFTTEILEDEEIGGYDLIISNPPFYTDEYKTNDSARNEARFTDTLPFQHLATCASHLLNEEGIFAIILPKKEENTFLQLAQIEGLYPQRLCYVKGTPESEVKRVLIQFSFKKQEIVEETLIIETTRHNYTPEYTALVKEFYLKM